jgi:putrescine aminotransferase
MKKKKLLTFEQVENLKLNEVRSLYKNFYNPGMEKLNGSFGFGNELVDYAEGINIHTENGKIIKDFTGGSGVLNHGHNNIRILEVRSIFAKKKRMEVHKTFFSKYLAGLVHNISKIMPEDLNIPFFCNSGAEANDGALKLAYKYHNGERKNVMYSDISFHGKLIGAGSITSADNALSVDKSFQFQKIPGTIKYKYNDINDVKKIIDNNKKKNNTSNIYAIIIEPFSASRLTSANSSFIKAIRKICDENDIVLIFDEVYTGWFKTGKLFYFLNFKVTPDILTTSKSFGGGKSSISTFITKQKFFKKAYGDLAGSLLHSTTFSGFGEECATSIEAINILFEENYKKKTEMIEQEILKKLRKLKKTYPVLIEKFKGCGAHFGIKLNSKINILKPLLKLIPSKFFSDKLFLDKLVVTSLIEHLYSRHNILCIFTANQEVYLWISPSLIVTKKEIDIFFTSLESSLNYGIPKMVLSFIKKQILKKKY